MKLAPLTHETLRRFVAREDVGAIAEATGQDWMAVRQLINVWADGKVTKARQVLDERVPPTPEEVAAAIARTKAAAIARAGNVSPLTAPIVVRAKSKPAVRTNPAPLPAVDAPESTPAVDIDDLDTVDGVMAVAVNHPSDAIRDKAARVSEALAELRQDIIRFRRTEAAAARAQIAELETKLRELQQLVGAS